MYVDIGCVETRQGMGLWQCVMLNGITVWAHAHAVDGPLDPQAKALYDALVSATGGAINNDAQ